MDNDPILIRQFTSGDVDFAIELSQQVGLSPWSRDDYLEEIDRHDSIMTIADIDSRSAGFLVGRRVPSMQRDKRLDAEIYNIGVVRGLQKRGIGGHLISNFLSECLADRVAEVWLEVRAGNAAAIAFYEKFSFEKVTVRKRFYDNPPDDGVVMRRILS